MSIKMPIIVGHIDYRHNIPRIPFFETETGNDSSMYLHTGRSLNEFGIWQDARYCRCGKKIDSTLKLEHTLEDPELENACDYLCPDCAAEDNVNICSLKGVPDFIITEATIQCKKCYKYLSNCASGYCVYLAILSNTPTEVKVGVTGLHRYTQRAAEGGYAAMVILLPKNSNSLSLPEAQFIEKKLIKGLRIWWQQKSLSVDEYFLRDLGDVGKDTTRQMTLAALLSPPSGQLTKIVEEIASSVISRVRERSRNYNSPAVKQLASLEVVDYPDITNGDVDEEELNSINLSNMTTIKTRKLQGRPARLIPGSNRIIAVKGPCVLLRSSDVIYSLKLSRSAVEGKEVFDPKYITKVHNSSQPCMTLLNWVVDKRC